jgi:hypothetical protein
MCITSIKRDEINKETVEFRKFSAIDTKLFAEDLRLTPPPTEITNVNTLVELFDSTVNKILDKHAPIRKCTITTRATKNLWFSEELRAQKHVVRCREKVFRKYKQHHQWLALLHERRTYTNLLKVEKRKHILEQITECKGDTKNKM